MNDANYHRKQGFSLIEIMVVIAIIAILATLAMPSQLGRVTQKRVIETLELVEPYKANISAYYHTHSGEFPANNEDAGLPEPRHIIGNYLQKMEVREGVMHLYLGQNLPQNLHNKIISIQPIFVKESPNSPISWICGLNKTPAGLQAAGLNLTDVDKVFLPGRCR